MNYNLVSKFFSLVISLEVLLYLLFSPLISISLKSFTCPIYVTSLFHDHIVASDVKFKFPCFMSSCMWLKHLLGLQLSSRIGSLFYLYPSGEQLSLVLFHIWWSSFTIFPFHILTLI